MKSIVHATDVYELPYIPEPSRAVFSYVDLRRHPEEIATIPELKDQPVLKLLIEALNDKDGVFMTHGCAFASRRPEGHSVIIPVPEESATAAHWVSCYVTFSFWRFSQNKEQEYKPLFERFSPEGSGAETCFVIQPAYFLTLYEQRRGAKWSDRNATVCLIWVSGWGHSAAVAHSKWRNAVKTLATFFSAFREVDGQTDSAVTVSDHLLSLNPNPPE